MSAYNLKTILNSYVREQAYLPFRSPINAWVCRVGSKGLCESLSYNSAYAFFSWGFFLRSLFARFRKTLSGLIVIFCAFNSL